MHSSLAPMLWRLSRILHSGAGALLLVSTDLRPRRRAAKDCSADSRFCSLVLCRSFAVPLTVVAQAPVAASKSGYQEPTAENIGQWLENPANIAAWEKSLA